MSSPHREPARSDRRVTRPAQSARPAPPADRGEVGAYGEAVAAAYLAARGYAVLARNWRVASGELRGELDLVCRHRDALVVVEVKTRRSDRLGGPLVAVTTAKQHKVRLLASAFLREAGVHARTVRFDVVGVRLRPDRDPEVIHVEGAF